MRFLITLLALATLQAQPAAAPYVLVIGVDGLRPDYADRFEAANLVQFRDSGSSAAGLVPCFPSTTFPNFYSMATGLTPERHGLVGMVFFDPDRGRRFFYRDGQISGDGSWYGGTPIWVLAEKSGMRTASYFWVGTEAEIQGVRPSWYFRYDGKVTHEQRVAQVLEWFRLPAGQRPHLVTLYFSDADEVGHAYGPDSQEVREAVRRVDRTLGSLFEGLRQVTPAVNVIIVSDHGMITVRDRIDLAAEADFHGFRVEHESTMIRLYSQDEALIDRTYKTLKGKSDRWEIYRRADIPRELRYSANPRIGDLVIVPAGPDVVGMGARLSDRKGMHGYDPRQFPEMHGVFYAHGPDIRPGVRLPAVENVHLYPFVAKLLGLRAPPDIDGRLAPLERLLR